jgi:hypothetical protein
VTARTEEENRQALEAEIELLRAGRASVEELQRALGDAKAELVTRLARCQALCEVLGLDVRRVLGGLPPDSSGNGTGTPEAPEAPDAHQIST